MEDRLVYALCATSSMQDDKKREAKMKRVTKKIFVSIFICSLLLLKNLIATITFDNLTATFQAQNSSSQIYTTPPNSAVIFSGNFKNGFKIPAGTIITYNSAIPVSGALDLSGTLSLAADLHLDAGLSLLDNSLSGSGVPKIAGNGYAVHLGGNLTIPANNFLHIGTNTIIEGHGNTLTFGANAQLLVDDNVTLTLRNVIVDNTKNYAGNPAILLTSNRSKLALDNATLDLTGDFYFNRGQFFVSNDVIFTGTNAFIYRSPMPSFITSGGKLYFDKNTTFSVAPATFTSCAYSTASTVTANNFILMADPTSTLYLDGATFCTTPTGLRLTTGSVFFDNKVSMRSKASFDLASTNTSPAGFIHGVLTGNSPYAVNWSPDGRFIAVANYNSGSLQIFRFTGSGYPTLVGSTISVGAGPIWNFLWSPDGRFIAALITGNSTLQIYRFNGVNTPTLVGSVATASGPRGLTWSPDGSFLAIVCTGGANGPLQIFSFNGYGNPTQIGSNVSTIGTYLPCVAWSPDAKFLAIVNETAPYWLQIFSISGGIPSSAGSVPIPGSSRAPWVTWSPDGRFLAVACYDSGTLQIYRFYGSNDSTPSLVGSVSTGSNNPFTVVWSPDGRFLALVNYGSSNMQIYRFNGSSAPTQVGGNISTGAIAQALSWSPNGLFIAVVSSVSAGPLQIFGVNQIVDYSTQALSNSIVFGNSALGSSYDVTARGLAGAQMVVDGNVNYDCVS